LIAVCGTAAARTAIFSVHYTSGRTATTVSSAAATASRSNGAKYGIRAIYSFCVYRTSSATATNGNGVIGACGNAEPCASSEAASAAASRTCSTTTSTTTRDDKIFNLRHAGRGSPVTRCGENLVFGKRSAARNFGSEQQTHNAAHGLTHVAVNNANRT
jgi:hypothetical protein